MSSNSPVGVGGSVRITVGGTVPSLLPLESVSFYLQAAVGVPGDAALTGRTGLVLHE